VPAISPSDTHNHATPLVRRLESVAQLTPEERQAILNLRGVSVREFTADQDIFYDGDRPSQCCLVLTGLACRNKMTGDAKRQILSFHISGDIPDLMSLHLPTMDHTLSTLSPTRLMFIPHETIRALCKAFPGIASTLWRETVIDAGIFREWITNNGRREAYGRLAHLICEMFLKNRAVNLAHGNTFLFPATQIELGDATGLSNVHVNRTLKELRAERLVTLEPRGRVVIHDWKRLQEAADFDPTYLHFDQQLTA
jgi:CRP-like cAMP-binding protein